MQEILNQVLGALRGMWKFRWPGLIVAWVVAVVGVVVVWRIPDQFEASARIYVDTDSILKPLMSGLAVQPNVEQQINMLSRTLLSRPNLEKLVRMADLDLKSQSKAEQEVLIERLQRGISMRTAVGGQNLYTMSYRDAEPEKAKRVVQSLVSIFVESGMGASRKDTASARSFLDEQIKLHEARLEEAEARMKEFRLRNLDRQSLDGKDVASRMAEISTQLEAARLQLREAERSRDAAKRQLAEERRQAPLMQAILGPGERNGASGSLPVQGLQTPEIDARIQDQRRNLDSLLQRFTDQHPDVLNARRLIYPDQTGIEASAAATFTIPIVCPDIKVEKTAANATVNAGGVAQFNIVVTNLGPGSATAVTLSDTLPAVSGAWILGGPDAAACTLVGTALNCNFGTIAAAGTKTINVSTTTVAADCKSLPNTATVAATIRPTTRSAHTVDWARSSVQ